MIEIMSGLPDGITGVRCAGKLTREDYDTVVLPLVDDALRDGRTLRALVEVESYDGITPSAAFEDINLGLRALGVWAACALVTDVAWVREVTPFMAFLMPFPVRVFPLADREQAVQWLLEAPAGASLTHRVLPDAGVVVVEASGPIGVADVESLATVVDGWLAEHPTLHGLVVHAPTVPGWENVGGLTRHLRFVLAHHRRIEKVALAVDGTAAGIGAAVAGRVLHAEVRRFPFSDIDAAVAWAGGKA
ncbi:STAS/SEC14 domain-containing protein [Pseudonocardia sp. CA-107938]|uniref:STAS/SEC14 domain-containing protein n=1 Tax=Pseudonocardia sp. CA-107938 TaxID=3240021 RepID=UPI003D8AB391